ncbi:hypothetical protein KF728_02675 [Candidatus Obscuribacterales bacterium]|nr:hypothetical protein [Candidatus Obscuribacterales bacterium]
MKQNRPTWNEQEPFWVNSGSLDDLFWFQSDYRFIFDALDSISDAFVGKWAVMTSFDCQRLTPLKPAPQAADLWTGYPKQVSGSNDFPGSGNDDEFYIFQNAPSADSVAQLNVPLFSDSSIHSGATESQVSVVSRRLTSLSAESYILIDSSEFFATRNEQLATQILNSEAFKNISSAHVEINKQPLRNWLSMETSDERCGVLECENNRVRFGTNCPRHHFEMLYARKFPDEFL